METAAAGGMSAGGLAMTMVVRTCVTAALISALISVPKFVLTCAQTTAHATSRRKDEKRHLVPIIG